MSDGKEISTEIKNEEGGKIIFANEVIATIAGLAAMDVKGIAGMSGGVVEGFTEMLGRKNLTKGVKVEVGTQEAAVDVSVVVEYGYKLQDVCMEVQRSIKNAIETMTGLKVVEVNVYIQAVNLDAIMPKQEKPKKEKPEKVPAPVEPPRVK